MITVETILGMGEGIKENGRGGESKDDTFVTLKNFYKCPSVPSPSTIKKRELMASVVF
jgi:hypothetical protein